MEFNMKSGKLFEFMVHMVPEYQWPSTMDALMAIVVEEDRQEKPIYWTVKPSKIHGNGAFATRKLSKHLILGPHTPGIVDRESDVGHCCNDLNYSASVANFKMKQWENFTYEDYQEMVRKYNDVENVKKWTNVISGVCYDNRFQQIVFMSTLRPIEEGAELSKLYSVEWWLERHLKYMIDLYTANGLNECDLLGDAEHPLIRTISEMERGDFLEEYQTKIDQYTT